MADLLVPRDRKTSPLVSRRRVIAGGTALAASTLSAPAILAQSTKPVKIGAIISVTKAFALAGESLRDGMDMYFAERNWTVAGRKIEIVREDDNTNPQVALQKLRKLVENDGVDIVVGPVTSPIAMAMLSYIEQSKTFWVVNMSATRELTRKVNPYVFRTSTTNYFSHVPIAKWLYQKAGVRNILLAASEFVSGREAMDQLFGPTFTALGGKVVKTIYAPWMTNDYSTYLLDIKSTSPEAVYCLFTGTDAAQFVKQFSDFGLKGKVKLFGSGDMFDSTLLPAQGKSAVGGISGLHYPERSDSSEFKKFDQGFRARFNKGPNTYAEFGYVGARVIAETLERTGGDTNKDKMAAAIRDVAFEAPRGPFKLDPDTHNPIQNVYIREVVEAGGDIHNRVIDTIVGVRDPGIGSL